MELSVREAATILGRSPRAVRAALARGELPGSKVGGRWVVRRERLPLSAEEHEALQTRAQEIRTVTESVLPSRVARTRGDRSRSVVDLAAFRAAHELVCELRASDSVGAAEAREELERGVVALAEAWHEFRPRFRLDALERSRAAFSRAVAALALAHPTPLPGEVLERIANIEGDIIRPLGPLFRQAERRLGGGRRELA